MPYISTNGYINNLSGTSGNIVFVQTEQGTIARKKVIPNDPQTPAQLATRRWMKGAQAAYGALTFEQMDKWRTYAASLTRYNKRTGAVSKPKAYTVFLGLATKFQQVMPDGDIPVLPPVAPFLGDGIVLTASGGIGNIIFTASGTNHTIVATELLLQKLASRVRTPQLRAYRSAGFHTFTEPSFTFEVEAEAGWYAVAYRFVHRGTGQESVIVPLGVYEVE